MFLRSHQWVTYFSEYFGQIRQVVVRITLQNLKSSSIHCNDLSYLRDDICHMKNGFFDLNGMIYDGDFSRVSRRIPEYFRLERKMSRLWLKSDSIVLSSSIIFAFRNPKNHRILHHMSFTSFPDSDLRSNKFHWIEGH